ncbi:uncharacterized protein LOC111903450 [Lactuca sativa]|uniref:uncharacterized protein LOC111903450 n=1 Tax=Lactuca sativa TaxID=4236 RepID=UPI000CD8EA60|nr:uncharacterized protein LOC111903450 [Lactuca sativa]
MDIPMGGPRYTWSDKWGSKLSKLDRFLVSDAIMLHFLHIMGLVLDKNILDHHPIVLLEHQVDYSPSPFRIFHSWFDQDGFDEVVHNSWTSNVVGNLNDNPWVIFKKKLQFLKSNLRLWNSNARECFISKRKTLQDEVEEIDASLMLDGGSADLREQRVSAIKELTDLDHLSGVELA